ncbi:MAG: N-acetylmuramoyl-L-alanine amidase [Cyanobacteria bacterium]|nr:N-acetylmuramoyl-L-alanine amidase [Cyanobacteriota bacterium]
MAHPAAAQTLFVAYPPTAHQTTAEQIFFIGTADPSLEVRINGAVVNDRSPAGHFAPSLPLALGDNQFTFTQGDETLTLQVTRLPTAPILPETLALTDITPTVDVARQWGERFCFEAIAPPAATVAVTWAGQSIPLQANPNPVLLPANYGVLIDQNAPFALGASRYEGCTRLPENTAATAPVYTLTLAGQTVSQAAPGTLGTLPVDGFEVATVVTASGTARTGPSTDYSRLTPLPQGTQAVITGRQGDWLRLDYGAWIRASETQITSTAVPPHSIIRSARSQQRSGWTEVLFPLEVPVPVTVDQTADSLTLTLHNTTPQTDTIYIEPDAAIASFTWQPILPDQAQYRLQLRGQPWGYKLHYDGTTLVLSLRHPPEVSTHQPLRGTTILLDPGHGSENDLGARGPNGYPEKDVTLILSQLLRTALEAKGATVVMTRAGDDDLYPGDRVDIINQVEPTLALSIHYNALPDAGDALNTAGIGTFWYHPQAQSLSIFLHDYLVAALDRPTYGIYWNNLALTRPTVAPSVLLELGFMINPQEFEWITDPEAQMQLAQTLADGIEAWMRQAVTD